MKRITILLLLILAAATGLFGCYLLFAHNYKDTVGPEITVEEGILEVSVEDPREMLLTGIRAVDDRDGDVTAGILIESVYGINDDNITTVTYAAFDSAGNVTKIQRPVRYRDYCPPRFELHGSPTFVSGSGFDLLEYVGAVDVLEGDISRRVHATLISDTKSIEQEGSHLVHLQVANSLGDTAEMTLPVQVYDSEWYLADVLLKDYLIYLEQGDSFTPRSYLQTFLVRGEPINISAWVPADITVEIDNTVNTDQPGVYEVTYTLSRTQNMTTHSGIARLIVIVE